MANEEQVEQAHELFRRLIQTALGRFTVLADQGLSLSQIRLLFVLAHSGPATVNRIAEQLHIGQSAASLLVDRLVQSHLAERRDDPADRRRAIVRLSEEGEALMGWRLPGQQRLRAWLSELDDTRIQTVIDAITTLLEIADDEDFIKEVSHE